MAKKAKSKMLVLKYIAISLFEIGYMCMLVGCIGVVIVVVFIGGLEGRIRMTLCVWGLEIGFILYRNMCYGFGANGLHVNQPIFHAKI